MAKAIGKRLTALERIANVTQSPKCADDFIAWERNLNSAERAVLMHIVEAELAAWQRQCWQGELP